jgi:hypothetical protein
VPVKNSPPSSVVHSSPPISSSSLDSTQQHINVKDESAQIEPSVPVKSPSILNSPMAPSQRTEVMMICQPPSQQAQSQMVMELQHREVDGFRLHHETQEDFGRCWRG